MGDPRRLRNKFISPRKIFDKKEIKRNKALMRKYGLKKTEEIWRAETILGKFRERARKLINTKNEFEEKVLFDKLFKYGLIDKGATVDDILDLELEKVLDRQLSSIVVKKGLANTMKQARQFITHGHIVVDGQKITSPRYLVPLDKEDTIEFYENSKLKDSFKVKEKAVQEEDMKKEKGNNVGKEENTDKEKGVKKAEEESDESESKGSEVKEDSKKESTQE